MKIGTKGLFIASKKDMYTPKSEIYEVKVSRTKNDHFFEVQNISKTEYWYIDKNSFTADGVYDVSPEIGIWIPGVEYSSLIELLND